MLILTVADRYPGARFDSESYTYAFFFDKELLDEWNWAEHFAPQPETERYIRFFCDKFKLWDDMQFNTRIASAHWLQDVGLWEVTDTDGTTLTSTFLITAIGVLSNPTLPNVPGVADFKGTAYHTSRWPKEPVSYEGKRVGIIGSGATAIQCLPVIAETAKSVTLFQRTANWVSYRRLHGSTQYSNDISRPSLS